MRYTSVRVCDLDRGNPRVFVLDGFDQSIGMFDCTINFLKHVIELFQNLSRYMSPLQVRCLTVPEVDIEAEAINSCLVPCGLESAVNAKWEAFASEQVRTRSRA